MTLATSALELAKRLGRANAAGNAIVDLEDEIKSQIGAAIREYNRRPWHLTELRGGTLTTAQGTTWYSTVDISAAGADQSVSGRTSLDTKEILDIHYFRENPGASGLNEPLSEVPYKKFEQMFEGSTPQGQPEYFTRYAGQIGIWPTPNAAHTLYFSGIVKPVIPTGDADTSVWLDEAEDLILANAGKRVCVNYLRDTDRGAEFAAMEKSELEPFESEHVRKSSTGRIKAHD